jgi:hypothetical protein
VLDVHRREAALVAMGVPERKLRAALLPLLNRAAHSEEYSKEAADWAITVGPKLLAGLDEKAVAAGGKPDQLWGGITPTGAIYR